MKDLSAVAKNKNQTKSYHCRPLCGLSVAGPVLAGKRCAAIQPMVSIGAQSGGISRGVDDIITVLTTDSSEWQQRPSLRLDSEDTPDWVAVFLIVGAIVLMALLLVSPKFRSFFFNFALYVLLNSGGSRSSGGTFSGSGGGGFSGGGGSSGGGGASGSW